MIATITSGNHPRLEHFPEFNRAKRDPFSGQARAGQLGIAKGNKAEVFRIAAEAASWKVNTEATEGRTVATATDVEGNAPTVRRRRGSQHRPAVPLGDTGNWLSAGVRRERSDDPGPGRSGS